MSLEFAIVPASTAVHRPETISVDEAAAMPTTVISATSGPRAGGDELAVTARALLDGVAATGARLIVVGGAGPLIVPASGGRLVVHDPRFVPGVDPGCRTGLRRPARCTTRELNGRLDLLQPHGRDDGGPARTGRFRTATDELIVDCDGTSRMSLEDVAEAVLDEAERPRHVRAVLTAGYSDPVRHSRAVDTVSLHRAEVTA